MKILKISMILFMSAIIIFTSKGVAKASTTSDMIKQKLPDIEAMFDTYAVKYEYKIVISENEYYYIIYSDEMMYGGEALVPTKDLNWSMGAFRMNDNGEISYYTSINTTKGTQGLANIAGIAEIYYSNYDMYRPDGTIFFQRMPVILAREVKNLGMEKTLTPLVGLLPLLIPCLILYLALRKGLTYLLEILHKA